MVWILGVIHLGSTLLVFGTLSCFISIMVGDLCKIKVSGDYTTMGVICVLIPNSEGGRNVTSRPSFAPLD